MSTFVSRSNDILQEFALLGSIDKEIEILFGRIKKGELHSRWDIIQRVEKFIVIVGDTIKKLEQEKITAEGIAFNKLQEIQELLQLIEDIDSEKIKNELNKIRIFLDENFKKIDEEKRLERRIRRGRKLRGFFIKKGKKFTSSW